MAAAAAAAEGAARESWHSWLWNSPPRVQPRPRPPPRAAAVRRRGAEGGGRPPPPLAARRRRQRPSANRQTPADLLSRLSAAAGAAFGLTLGVARVWAALAAWAASAAGLPLRRGAPAPKGRTHSDASTQMVLRAAPRAARERGGRAGSAAPPRARSTRNSLTHASLMRPNNPNLQDWMPSPIRSALAPAASAELPASVRPLAGAHPLAPAPPTTPTPTAAQLQPVIVVDTAPASAPLAATALAPVAPTPFVGDGGPAAPAPPPRLRSFALADLDGSDAGSSLSGGDGGAGGGGAPSALATGEFVGCMELPPANGFLEIDSPTTIVDTLLARCLALGSHRSRPQRHQQGAAA